MGLLKTFLLSTSAHGVGKTLSENATRRKIWMAICFCCYAASLGCILNIIFKAIDPENTMTRFNSEVISLKGKSCNFSSPTGRCPA